MPDSPKNFQHRSRLVHVARNRAEKPWKSLLAAEKRRRGHVRDLRHREQSQHRRYLRTVGSRVVGTRAFIDGRCYQPEW